MKYEIEEVSNGVWVQSAFEPDECVHSVGLEWADFAEED